MTENEAIEVISHAIEQSGKVMAELAAVKDKAEKIGRVGEYYANLENCLKEIESCEVAISALQEIQQYRSVGTVEEVREYKEISDNMSAINIPELLKILDQMKKYLSIGTLEECSLAVEKQKAVEAIKMNDRMHPYLCPKCSSKLDLGYKYCIFCGQELKYSN